MEHKNNGPHKGSPIQRMMSNHLPPPPQDNNTNNQVELQKIDNNNDQEQEELIHTSIVPLGQDISTLLVDNENDDDNSVYSSVFSSDDSEGDISDGISELGSSFGNMSHNTNHSDTNDRLPSSDLEGSTMGIPNINNEDNNLVPSIPTYPEGQYEDDKAQLIAKLLQNHGGNFGKFIYYCLFHCLFGFLRVCWHWEVIGVEYCLGKRCIDSILACIEDFFAHILCSTFFPPS